MNNKTLLMVIVASLSFSFNASGMKEEQSNNFALRMEEQINNFNFVPYVQKFLEICEIRQMCKEKLSSYENNLLTQKQNALTAIKDSHQIDDTLWKSCIKLIKDVELFNKNNLSLPLPNVHHDASIPENTLFIIKEQLNKNGINPDRMDIKRNSNLDFLHALRLSTPSISVKKQPKLCDNKTSYSFSICPESIKPGEITINDDLCQADNHTITMTCSIIINHIKQNCSLPCSIIATLEPFLTSQSNAITTSPHVNNLRKLCCNTLPLLLPSIKNHSFATFILQMNDSYDFDFNESDYKLLHKIITQHTLLQQYQL